MDKNRKIEIFRDGNKTIIVVEGEGDDFDDLILKLVAGVATKTIEGISPTAPSQTLQDVKAVIEGVEPNIIVKGVETTPESILAEKEEKGLVELFNFCVTEKDKVIKAKIIKECKDYMKALITPVMH